LTGTCVFLTKGFSILNTRQADNHRGPGSVLGGEQNPALNRMVRGKKKKNLKFTETEVVARKWSKLGGTISKSESHRHKQGGSGTKRRTIVNAEIREG